MTGERDAETGTVEQYPNVETVRWIVDVSRSGDGIALDDGSKWHVVPSHRLIAGNWPRTLKLRVSPVQGRLYTLSAESDRDVQAVYQGLRPLHEEITVETDAGTETATPATSAASEPEGRSHSGPSPKIDS